MTTAEAGEFDEVLAPPGDSTDPFGREYSMLRLRADLARFVANLGAPWRVEVGEAAHGPSLEVRALGESGRDPGEQLIWRGHVDARPPTAQLAEWKRAVARRWIAYYSQGHGPRSTPGTWCAPD